MKQFDVIALGELLIDMTDNGVSGQGNTLFEANPGGAPCNVLAMLTKLGHKTGFIGKVGEDLFGRKLKAVLEEVGIDTSNLCVDKDARTTLALWRRKKTVTGISPSTAIRVRICCFAGTISGRKFCTDEAVPFRYPFHDP